MVSSRRRAEQKCALFLNSIKAATFLKAFQVQFFLYGQENYIKGIFVRINVSQTFYNFCLRKFEKDFVLTLPRAHPIFLALRILISWFFNRNFQEIITLSHWCKRCIKEVFN